MLANQDSYKQTDFKIKLYPPMERMLILDQLKYRKPIRIVRQFFDFCMQLRIQGEVRITPNYPTGWFAEVLSEDKIWTIECDRGELKLIKVGDLAGYAKNGGYIIAAEEICDDMYYQECHQWCEYRGLEKEPVYCRDFCDDGYCYEFRCRCCPWVMID